MEKRTAKERFMPLGINLVVATVGLGVGNVLCEKARKLEGERKYFTAGVVQGLGTGFTFVGSMAATLGTLFTAIGACVKEKYTDEEMDEILEQ